MDKYIFIVRDMSELVEAVNEKMGDGYEPLGGPVFFPHTTKLGDGYEPLGSPVFFPHTTKLGQAMVRFKSVTNRGPCLNIPEDKTSELVEAIERAARQEIQP